MHQRACRRSSIPLRDARPPNWRPRAPRRPGRAPRHHHQTLCPPPALFAHFALRRALNHTHTRARTQPYSAHTAHTPVADFFLPPRASENNNIDATAPPPPHHTRAYQQNTTHIVDDARAPISLPHDIALFAHTHTCAARPRACSAALRTACPCSRSGATRAVHFGQRGGGQKTRAR